MDEEAGEKVYTTWVNWETRVVSFTQAEGFTQLQYPTYGDMLRFVVENGSEGFGIQ